MKDIKKSYEGVEITMNEKEKIYNNIMNKRKKPFDFRILFLVGTVCLIVLGVFLFKGPSNILQNNNETNNPIQNKKDRDYKLENNYKKEIITNVESFLEANYIDVSELKDGEELVIESSKIVTDDKYSTCKGKLVIKRYYDSYSYSPEITCDGNDENDKEERKFILYSGTLDNTFEVDDYIVISSKFNVVKKNTQAYDIQKNEYIPSNMIVDNDINITIFDKEGNVVLSKLIESEYKNEDSTMSVKSVNIIDDYYYVNLDVTHNRNFNEFGAGTETIEAYEMIFDKDGKEILYDRIVDANGSRIVIGMGSDSYLGHDGKTIYYTGYHNDDFVIIKITKDKIETISYDTRKENPDGVTSNYRLMSQYKGEYYGYSYIKTTSYSARDLFKLDKDGKLLWNKTIVPEGYNIHKILAYDDKIYILSSYNNIKLLTITDLDGEVIKSISVEDLVDGLDVSGNVSFYAEKDNIVVVISDIHNVKKYFAVLDNDLNKIKTIDINESSSAYEFDYTYLDFSRLNGNKYTNIYSVDSSFLDSKAILMVISNITENDIMNKINEVAE